jgi:hypothetical protein
MGLRELAVKVLIGGNSQVAERPEKECEKGSRGNRISRNASSHIGYFCTLYKCSPSRPDEDRTGLGELAVKM